MFGFKKKEQKPLWIMGKDVMEIIRSDYDEGMAFTLIEFHYQGNTYLMGSCIVPPDAEERKENISFVFQDQVFQEFDEFQANASIDGIRISELEGPIEVVRAGIIGNDTMLKTPWGETRLATDYDRPEWERDWYLTCDRGGFILYHKKFIRRIVGRQVETEIAEHARGKVYYVVYEDVDGKIRKLKFSSDSLASEFLHWFKKQVYKEMDENE